MNQGKVCSSCGNSIGDNDNFCKKCGMPCNNSMVQNVPIQTNNNQSSNSWIFAILGVVIVIVIVGLYVYFSRDENDILSDNKNTVPSNSEKEYNDDKSVNTDLTKNVSYKGFTFKTPQDYTYTNSEGMLLFSDSTKQWYVVLDVIDSNYDELENNVDSLISELKKQGLEVINYKLETIARINNIIIETKDSVDPTKNLILGYAKAGESNTFVISVINTDNSYDYTRYNEFVWVLSTAF